MSRKIYGFVLWSVLAIACGDSAATPEPPTQPNPPAEIPFNEQTFTIEPKNGGQAVPQNPSALFSGGEDPARAPKMIYPNDGILVPPNLGRLEIHWLKGTETNTLFEVSFRNTKNNVTIYTRCERPDGIQADGCIAELPSSIWQGIIENHGGGEPFNVQIRATDDSGSGVGTSSKQTLELALSDILGALYYWTTTKMTSVRFDFGSEVPTPEIPLDPATLSQATDPQDKCFGCHALSLDGNKLATSAKRGSGGLYVYDFANKVEIVNETADNDQLASFVAFRPDGKQLAVVSNDQDPNELRKNVGIRLWNVDCTTTHCGTKGEAISLGGAVVTHPDWSPDGTKIVFAKINNPNPTWDTSFQPVQGNIEYIERQNDGWSAPKPWLAYETDTSKYAPNFSPDSSLAVFSQSSCPVGQPAHADCNGNSDAVAKLRAVAMGSSSPVTLTKANAQGALDATADLQNTFPKFSPFASDYQKDGSTEQVFWVTFSSTRKYGLRSPPPPVNGRNSTLIWMAGFRASELNQGRDPSFPPFVIPYQDITTSNHQAAWARQLVGSTR